MKVPPCGPLDAKIIALGEAPAAEEEKQGKPFVGAAGQLLNDFLGAVGIDRREIFITNVLKERIPGEYTGEKKDSYFFSQGAPTSVYMSGIIETLKEIKLVQSQGGANIIVPMGNYALWAMTQHKDISKWRGSILESSLVPGLKVVPTMHPAYFLHSRMFHEQILSEWDWQRIAEESKTPDIVLPDATFITDPSGPEMEEAIFRFTNCDLLTVDTEWRNPDSLAYIGFSDAPDYAVIIPSTSMQAYRAYKAILSSDVPKVLQNAIFDDVALDRIGIKVVNVKHDLMVAWNACWGDIRKKRLGVITSVMTRWPYYKEDLEFVGKNDEKGMIYCGMDCVSTNESMDGMLKKELRETGTEKAYELSMLNYNIFSTASKIGLLADTEKLRELQKGYISRANVIEDELSKVAGKSLNCRSWQQIAKFVYDDLGYGRKTKTRSTAQEDLMELAATEEDRDRKELLTAIIRVRQYRNIVSRYINDDVVDRDGRIRTNWNLAGTRNGRYSTTDPWWNGWAQQTVPLDAREIVIADPGHVFVGWDGEQAEARVVAVMTHDYDLLDRMAAGIDIHAKLVEDLGIFNMTYDQVIAECKRLGDKDQCHPRYLCKKTRHSSNYKQGWSGLKTNINKEYLDTGVGINAPIAKVLSNGYISHSPGLSPWWKETYLTLRNQGYLVNHWGRRRTFLGEAYEDSHLHRDAIAFVPQSDIADLTTVSIFEAQKRITWGQCFAHMHDGGFFQVPEKRAEETAAIINEEMHREIVIGNDTLTVPVTIKVGTDWKNMR